MSENAQFCISVPAKPDRGREEESGVPEGPHYEGLAGEGGGGGGTPNDGELRK